MQNILLFLYTETPLHAGVGSSVSVVDLPIQRERTTQYPIVQGTGVKGALRSQCSGAPKSKVEAVFGPENERDASKHAGAIAVGDARIVLFPVRALKGVFAYVTSQHALARLARDLSAANANGIPSTNFNAAESGKTLVSDALALVDGQIVLEEFSFTAQQNGTVAQWAKWLADNALPQDAAYEYWRGHLKSYLVVLPEDDFRDFVVNSTQIETHVKLEQATKTVKEGALWTTESLPPDSLLVSSITVRATRGGENADAQQVRDWLIGTVPARLQLGGDETTGQGVVAARWAQGVE
jgi:CRISPR-associated protein Cmr4